MLLSLLNSATEDMVYNSWNNPSLVLVLLDTPQERRLLDFLTRVILYYIVPVVSKHSVGLSTACLSISQNCHIITFFYLLNYRLNLFI